MQSLGDGMGGGHKQGPRVAWKTALVLTAGASVLSAGVWQRTRSLDAEVQRLRGALVQPAVGRPLPPAPLLDTRLAAPPPSRDAEHAATVAALRAELDETRTRLTALESERRMGETVIRRYGPGVALIQGAYGFTAPDGTPARVEAITDDEGKTEGDLVLPVSEHVVEYYGTGFLVDGSGLILSNRHIAEPWWNDDAAGALVKRGFKPRFIRLRAFFPGETEGFDLTPHVVSNQVDLAILQVDLRGRRIPALPLAGSAQAAVAGQPVVVLGYPTGLEAIMAKSESGVVRTILDTHGNSRDRVTEAFSRRGLIRPSATQGHIGDITETDIVFDAATTQGGSGGPIFNRDGQVIAVEYAVLPQFGGNSFAVPISYALEILRVARDPELATAD
jgi:serine protease Do